MKYDFLIVGAGLFGATFANLAKCGGYKVLVIDKRNHIAGNSYTEDILGIKVHKYGPHIFHTNDKYIWDYVNSFDKFNNFINMPIAKFGDEVYNLPFNMNTFTKIWSDVKTADDVKRHILDESKEYLGKTPVNLEEKAISLVGKTIYELLIKGYTEKQWGKECSKLPVFLIERIPLRFDYNNNYYDDLYQGIPSNGYTLMVKKMLDGIEIKLNTDYFSDRAYFNSIASNIVYTGMLDEYFERKYGLLEYRSLKFDSKIYDVSDYQGNAVVNYPGMDVSYTRVIEHKHFDINNKSDKTIVTYEYPDDWNLQKEAYYTVNNEINNCLADKYRLLADNEKNVIFGGRLAEYKYYDMDDVINSAMHKYEKHIRTLHK